MTQKCYQDIVEKVKSGASLLSETVSPHILFYFVKKCAETKRKKIENFLSIWHEWLSFANIIPNTDLIAVSPTNPKNLVTAVSEVSKNIFTNEKKNRENDDFFCFLSDSKKFTYKQDLKLIQMVIHVDDNDAVIDFNGLWYWSLTWWFQWSCQSKKLFHSIVMSFGIPMISQV